MNIKNGWILVFMCSILFFQSCISYERLVNFEKEGTGLPLDVPENITNAEEITIQPYDVLSITVHSQDVATAAPFNLSSPQYLSNQTDPNLYQLQGYLINQNGEIEFPILGKINLKGMTKDQIKVMLEKKVSEYLKDPVIIVRLLNFRVTVSGEVRSPGLSLIHI